MTSTPHRPPEPWDATFGLSASEPVEPASTATLHEPDESDPEESTEWGAAPGPEESTEWGAAPDDHASGWAGRDPVATWHAEPAADHPRYDDETYQAPDLPATLYASGPGLPPRGVLLTTGMAVAGCAGLDFFLTGGVGYFFDLCFVVVCLVAAMSAAPRALFTVGVMPPLAFGVVIAVVAVVAPHTIATGSFSAVFLTGLAAHAVPLCAAYAVALVVVTARGIAHRSPQPRG
jgi:hypothetical protein